LKRKTNPDDLKPNAANFGRLGACRAIIYCGKCRKPTSLRPVFALPRQSAKLWRIEVAAQWPRNLHDEPPGFAMLNPMRLNLGIAHESEFLFLNCC
jgi:hypothetical protein